MSEGLINAPLRAALHRYPFMSGGIRLAQRDPFRRVAVPSGVAEAKLRNGASLFVLSDDFLGRGVLLTGEWDPKITWLCRRVLRPGDTMLDVGANLGVVTAFAAPLVGASGAVHAFEPQPRLVELMERSMAVNGYRQVTIHPVALSEEDGRLPMYGGRGHLATASLEAEHADQPQVATAEVRAAGRFLESLSLGPIRLLKLDVEGHEESFLRGALEYLRGNAPQVIAFESHGREPFTRRPVVALLSELGYEFFQIPKAWLTVKLRPIRGDSVSAGWDYVAIQPGSGLAAALT